MGFTMHPKYLDYLKKAYFKMASDILSDVAKNGLTDNSHYFISFNTQHPDVQIPDFLRAQYPDGMSIVLQHQFENLTVSESGFSVTLTFGGIPVTLSIPFEAFLYLADPDKEFALSFPNVPSENIEKKSTPSSDSADVIDLKSRLKK